MYKLAAAETELKEGSPVVAGSSDAIASMNASGLSKLGEATEVSGMSPLIFAGTHSRPEDYHTVAPMPVPSVDDLHLTVADLLYTDTSQVLKRNLRPVPEDQIPGN